MVDVPGRTFGVTLEGRLVGVVYDNPPQPPAFSIDRGMAYDTVKEMYDADSKLKDYLKFCVESGANIHEGKIEIGHLRDSEPLDDAGAQAYIRESLSEMLQEEQSGDAVNHPKHYNSHPSGIECIEIVRHMGFNLGNVVKYIWRDGHKDSEVPLQDLKKALWYLQDEIAMREERS